MRIDYKTRLEEARSLADIFEVVKSLVLNSIGKSRGGLMLGMADLGNHPQGFSEASLPQAPMSSS